MDDQSPFAVYLSHSWWPEDVELNLKVWSALADEYELLVDAPKEAGPNPPYYINRIEELLRRTDVFVSVLTYRPSADPTAKLRCSPYSSFEIQLAERADLPRLVLYDRRSGFRPPETKRPWAVYQVFDRGEGEPQPEQRQWRIVERAIGGWLDWVKTHRKPSSYELSTDAAVLLDRHAHLALAGEIDRILHAANFRPWYCDGALSGDEALRRVREAGLVISDFSGQSDRLRQVYAAAHGLGVPAIRLLDAAEQTLPWILDGDAGGYREDVVRWTRLDEAIAAIEPRINAMLRLSPALQDTKAPDYLQSKRYAKFCVFVSHTARDGQPTLIERVCAELRKRRVPTFEYNDNNIAGADWKAELDAALAKTTHFVALLTDHYEQSEYCTYEIRHVIQRGKAVSVLPFLLGNRTKENPDLKVPHHTSLRGLDAEAAAARIVEQVLVVLDAANNQVRR